MKQNDVLAAMQIDGLRRANKHAEWLESKGELRNRAYECFTGIPELACIQLEVGASRFALDNLPSVVEAMILFGKSKALVSDAECFERLTFLLAYRERCSDKERVFLAAAYRFPEAAIKYIRFYEDSIGSLFSFGGLLCQIPLPEDHAGVANSIKDVEHSSRINRSYDDLGMALPDRSIVHPANLDIYDRILEAGLRTGQGFALIVNPNYWKS